jgi:hypothetical protein
MSAFARMEQRLLDAKEGSPDLDRDLSKFVLGEASLSPLTRSIDCALGLVEQMLPDYAWSIESSRQFPGHAWLYPPDNVHDIVFEAKGASPALAVCLAAVRALQAKPPTPQQDTITEEM